MQLDFGTPVTAMLWPKTDTIHHLTLFPREDFRVRLYFERFCADNDGVANWTTFLPDTPLRINGLKDFWIHKRHMSSIDRSPSLVSGFTEAGQDRRRANYLEDRMLDFSTPITGMLWLEDGAQPKQVILYPREDLRVRLEDNLMVLNEVGLLEDDDAGPQRFCLDAHTGIGAWWSCLWDTPLKVCGPGDTLLLSREDSPRVPTLQLM
ncbi:hypothetical protein B0H17DRAFT_1201652 [Mycena rosella]|uniref:Uncharacterized protein n=1 Tax=Mycena rosella TaxID=1033263 RepID=A0AAD7GH25_MYCRO|nr:hypothetical protein B0H17DRAFT_1201652 [Mycena rosella]